MGSIFENIWLLLTVAGIALVAVSIIRQARPEWGHWPLLVPLAIVGLAFGLDSLIQTDKEAIGDLFTTCRKAVINHNTEALMKCISPNYSDRSHPSKAVLESAVRRELDRIAIEKVKTQSHLLTVSDKSAVSELNVVVHLDKNSSYGQTASLVFVGLELRYEKIGDTWYIYNVNIVSVNNQPWNW